MANITCEVVDDLFTRETGRFGIDIHDRFSTSGPWGRLVRVGKFPLGMGLTINELTVERIMTGSFESDWSNVALSDGDVPSTSNGCIPDPTELEFGQTVRNWQLQTKSYMTPCICLDDLKTGFQIQQQLRKTVNESSKTTEEVLTNRRRTNYIGMVSKLSAGVLAPGMEVPAIDDAFPVPTSILTQDLLDSLYMTLLPEGINENPIGRANGVPLVALITSPETSRNLLRANPDIREDIRHAKPNELLAPLGVDRSFGNYYHIGDVHAPRYTYNPGGGPGLKWTRIYPYVKNVTTKGVRWDANPAYFIAPYELSIIFHPDVYEEAVQQVGPNIADAPFEDYPYYYTGQPFWLNIRHAQNNPLGKIGRWLLIFQNGARPISPYLGRAIMHRRCIDIPVIGCPGDSTPAPTLASIAPTTDAAGEPAVLTGTNFTGTTVVLFGDTPAMFVVVNDTTINVIVPEGLEDGEYNVTVTTAGGTTDPVVFEVDNE